MRCAVRLGLRLVGGLAEEATKETILKARGDGYADIPSLWMRSGAPVGVLERLADADAFRSIGLDRRAALWAVKGLDGGALHTGAEARHLRAQPADDLARTRNDGQPAICSTSAAVDLPETTLGEHVVQDYAAIGLSLKAHPVAFFREELARRGVITSAAHWDERLAGRRVTRGRPGAGAAAARHRQGRDLPHARGRDRHRQRRGLAQGVREEPPHGDDGAVPGGARQDRARGPRHPRRRRAADRPHATSCARSATARPACPRPTRRCAKAPGNPRAAISIEAGQCRSTHLWRSNRSTPSGLRRNGPRRENLVHAGFSLVSRYDPSVRGALRFLHLLRALEEAFHDFQYFTTQRRLLKPAHLELRGKCFERATLASAMPCHK